MPGTVPYMRTWAQVGEIVKDRRNKLHLTQKQVVTAAGEGLSLANLQAIEAGKSEGMKPRTRTALARALNWPMNAIDLLVEDDESPERLPILYEAEREGSMSRHPYAERQDVLIHKTRSSLRLLEADIHELYESVATISARLDKYEDKLNALSEVSLKVDRFLEGVSGRAEAVAGSLPLADPARPAPRARKRKPPAAEAGGRGP